MSEELEVLYDVVRRLEGLGVPYMLTGSFAANIYAVPRMTRDIDLVIELDAAQVPRFAREFENDYYCDGNMVGEAVRERKMFNLIHNHALLKIDFIIRKEADYRKAEFARRRTIEIQGRKVWVVSPEDLLPGDCMNDTDKAIESLQRERFQRKTATERMRMGSSMFDTARKLMESGFSSQNPTWDRQRMKFHVFKAFYANDFTENQMQKIQAHFFPPHHPLHL